MPFPPPTQQQAKIFWSSVTALAIGVLIGLIGLLFVGLGIVINRLSAILLPLAIAGIIAYLFDPVVCWLEKKRIPRTRGILLVFFMAIMSVLILLATVVPQLVAQIGDLIDNVPDYVETIKRKMSDWLNTSGGEKARNLWETYGESVQHWATETVPTASGWVLSRLGRVASWFGLLVGLFLVPVYVFYFLLEKKSIEGKWTDYLPLSESRWKDELVFVLKSVNDSLIVFFRGQVFVAMCVGALTATGFWIIGLNYALLLGVMTGMLGIVPYLGVMVSFVPAIILGIVQFGDWRVLLVVLVFVGAQTAEGLIISPKIIGDRVGLHPLTIIIAVMIGTALMGGILGGVLAIPLTAALRSIMFRYIWKRRVQAQPDRGSLSRGTAE